MTLVTALLSIFSIGVFAQNYNEAPMLSKLAKDGKIPVVAKRLPVNPVVVKTVDEIGQYGGTAYLATIGGLGGFDDDLHFIGFEAPLFLDPGGDVHPNVIEKWEYSKDYKEVTLHIRKGLKWSDGVELIADDIMFFWNDEVKNEDYTTSIYIEEFKNATFEKIDKYSVKITFAKSFPLFDLKLAKQWAYQGRWWRPAHYAKQFNSHYVDIAKLKSAAKEEGHSTYKDYYYKSVGNGPIPSVENAPTLTAFVLKKKTLSYWEWERNPYYFKVDEKGNQLPYIDNVVVKKIDDIQALQGMIISGQVDLSAWNTTLENYPLYKKNEVTGSYNTLLWKTDKGAEVKFIPNLNTKNKQLNKLFNDIRFRQALSLAINRDEINKLLYFCRAVPRQYYLLPNSKCYEKKYENYYAQFDPEKAGRLLDEMGLNKKNKDGYRLDKNGKRIEILIEFWAEEPVAKGSVTELVKEYWEKIGLKIAVKSITRGLLNERSSSEQLQITNWEGGGVVDSDWLINMIPPIPGTGLSYAPHWGEWFESNGKKGNTPDVPTMKMIKLMKNIISTTDEAERVKFGKELWSTYVEQVYNIGTVGMAPKPIIANKRLFNVPKNGTWGSTWLHSYSPEQFFLKK